jgi:ribosomal protein S18 acetylase RimI-like enzyme
MKTSKVLYDKSMSPDKLLARAFQEDPYFCWAEPDSKRRPRVLEAIFAAMIHRARGVGGVVEEPGVSAVEWKRPSHAHLGIGALLTSGMWRVAFRTPPIVCWRLAAHDTAAMVHVRKELTPDCIYLSSLGVEPSLAGRGHGGRLLERAVRNLPQHWKRCVLRTEQPRNVAFYRNHGFELVAESLIDASKLPVWIFSRSLR